MKKKTILLSLLVGLTLSSNPVKSQDCGGSFTQYQVLPRNNGENFRQYADINGDGLIDLITQDNSAVARFYLNTGSGFTAAGSLQLPPFGNVVAAKDFDNDGRVDLLSNSITGTNCLSNQIRIFWNTGTNNAFFNSALNTNLPLPVNPYCVQSQDIDFNGDGLLDIIATSMPFSPSTNSPGRTYLNNGNRNFTVAADFLWPRDLYGTYTRDFNGDGNADFLVTVKDGWADGLRGMYYYRGNGNGTFQAPIVNFNSAPLAAGGIPIQADPLNNNTEDVLMSLNGVSPSTIKLGRWNGVNNFAFNDISIPSGFATSQAYDFDLDGKQDIMILSSNGNNTLRWMAGNGDGTFTANPNNVLQTSSFNLSTLFNDLNPGTQYISGSNANQLIVYKRSASQVSLVTENVTACSSYIWNGNTYTQSGAYTWTGNNAAGCDSVVTLNLTITPQPEQPAIACWQTATFNAESCSWVISGTQPIEPSNLSCWETATFNANACAWVVSGTQPEQPTNLACYETALFVDTLCNWVVTGTPAPAIVTNASACVSYTWEANGETYSTSSQYSFNSNCQEFVLNLTIDGQPEQPQLACWQTATFDAASCSWVIGGTQPVEPTDLACWETATFNANACAWVVSGTQPEQPTNLACYETALFVDTLCNWVVTGTPAPAIVTNASACVSYTWEANGETYNTSGQYSFNSNCQEFVLNLVINQASAETVNAIITEGESYSFNGQSLTSAGTYTATLQNAAGCDSVVTLNLTVEPAVEPLNCEITTSDAEICLGQSTNLTVPFSPSAGNVLDTIFNRYSAFEYSFQANGSWKTEIGGWQTGNAPFGNTTGGEVDNNAPEFAYNTFWPTGSTLFVRRSFNLDGFSPEGVRWKLGVDNGYNLFVNGNFVSGIYEDGFTSTWEYEGLIPAQYLNSGDNIIALELTDGGFLTAFDMMLEGNRNQAETSILWSTGETTPSISVSPAETTTYSVTVAQGNQTCTSEVTITVNQPSAETVNASITEGESYNFNGQNLTAAGTYTATLQNAAGCDSVVTLNLTVNPASVGGCYAATVVSFEQGPRRDGTPVTAIRSDSNQALGMPEPVVNNVVNFVSLGFGGSLTLAFETPIANGPGADIRIDEATWGNYTCNNYPESADVFASQDGINFVFLGTACHDAEFDLGAISWAQYIRIVDVSNLLSFTSDADGFDVNGVSCLNGAATSFSNDGLVACSAQEIVSYQAGNRKNGSAIPAARRNSNNALGMPQNNNTINFVALGFGGSLVAKFDYVVFNQDGNDIRVVETSYGNPSCNNYPERAIVSVSMDNVSWTELGEICQDGEFDLGNVPYAQFVKIEDASPIGSSRFNGSADGYDVDAVVVLNNGCGMNTARVAQLDNTQTPDTDLQMHAYPNPIEDYTVVRFDGLEKDETFKLEIFDASGRLVRSENISVSISESSYLLPAQELARGLYRMVVSNESGFFTEQLVK